MALETRGRARGGKHHETTVRIATPRGGFRAWRETIAAEGVTFPLLIGLVHIALVQIVATLAYRYGTPNPQESYALQITPPALEGVTRTVVEPFRQWDGLWYRLIALEGYDLHSATAAFWPLYPWLMRLGHDLTGWSVETVGWIISHVCFLAALILLYRLVSLDFDLAVTRRTIVAIALFPTAFFFSAIYTESLFLLLVVASLLAARQGNWFMAGCLGLLTALTRSQGVLLLAPFAVLFLQQHRWNPLRWLPNGLFAALPALGPVLFGWHLHRQGQEWLAFARVQEQWNRYQAWPWETMRCAIEGCYQFQSSDGVDWNWLRLLRDHPTWSTWTSAAFRTATGDSDVLELIATVVALALAVVGLKILPFYMSAYIWPPLLFPLFGPSQVHALMSMPRFILVLFPLFVLLAIIFRRRRVALPALALSCVLLVLFTMQFAQWYWVS